MRFRAVSLGGLGALLVWGSFFGGGSVGGRARTVIAGAGPALAGRGFGWERYFLMR